jgi:hypothetical protein
MHTGVRKQQGWAQLLRSPKYSAATKVSPMDRPRSNLPLNATLPTTVPNPTSALMMGGIDNQATDFAGGKRFQLQHNVRNAVVPPSIGLLRFASFHHFTKWPIPLMNNDVTPTNAQYLLKIMY